MDQFFPIENLKNRLKRWCEPYKPIVELIVDRICADMVFSASMSAAIVIRNIFYSVPWIDFMVKKHPRIWVLLTVSGLTLYTVKIHYRIDGHHLIKHIGLNCMIGLSMTLVKDDILDMVSLYGTVTMCGLLFFSHFAFIALFLNVCDTIFGPAADTAIRNRNRLSTRKFAYATLIIAFIEMGYLITFSAKAVPRIRSMSMMKMLTCIDFWNREM